MGSVVLGVLLAALLGGCTTVDGPGGLGEGVPSTTLSEGGELVPVGEVVVRQELVKARELAEELAGRVGGVEPPGELVPQSELSLDDLDPTIGPCEWADEEWPAAGTVFLSFDLVDPHARLEKLAAELEQREGWEVRFTGGESDSDLTAIRPDGIGVTITAQTRAGVSRGSFMGFTACVGEDGALGR